MKSTNQTILKLKILQIAKHQNYSQTVVNRRHIQRTEW